MLLNDKKALIESAVKKLSDTAQKKGCSNNKASVMYSHIVKALKNFCEQNVEFAEAVLQSNKTVGECADSIGRSINGSSISDIEVYRKAAEFYFPGCVVEFEMKLYMSKYEKDEPQTDTSSDPKKMVTINLFDLL